MLAVDTNVIVRFLTRDDEKQFSKVDALIRDEDIYVPVTVLLETEWVLRTVYGYPQSRIIEALHDFAALSRVNIEDPLSTAKAFQWAGTGMDFADALHLARAQHCSAFVSFDRRLTTAAARNSGVPVRAP